MIAIFVPNEPPQIFYSIYFEWSYSENPESVVVSGLLIGRRMALPDHI